MIYKDMLWVLFFYVYNVHECFSILFKILLARQSWNSLEDKLWLSSWNVRTDIFGSTRRIFLLFAALRLTCVRKASIQPIHSLVDKNEEVCSRDRYTGRSFFLFLDLITHANERPLKAITSCARGTVEQKGNMGVRCPPIIILISK